MHNTKFYSVHGLPPTRGKEPDITTARDMATLSRGIVEISGSPEIYINDGGGSSVPDVPEPFIMRTHNHLLKDFEGCDGLKTGYFSAAGFSIAATAKKNDVRAIAVVLGSKTSKERDKHARLLLSKGLMEILLNPPAPEVAEHEPVEVAEAEKSGTAGRVYKDP